MSSFGCLLIFMPGKIKIYREPLISSSSELSRFLWDGRRVASSVKILLQWRAGHRCVCTRDHPPPSLFCLRWILTILIPRTSWSTQCRGNSRPRISKPSTTLSMWRLATGVSSIFFSLSCFGSTFSQCGISQFQINPSLISCSTPIFVLSP